MRVQRIGVTESKVMSQLMREDALERCRRVVIGMIGIHTTEKGSLLADLMILAKTAQAAISGRGAY